MFNKLTTALAALGLANCRIRTGGCPNYKKMEDFDQTQYVGHWYEIKRDYWNTMTMWAECVTKEFELREDGNVDLYFRGEYPWGFRGATGVLYNCPQGQCEATMGSSPFRSNFDVFYTDYNNFEIYYECQELFWGTMRNERIAISSRTPHMTPTIMNEVKKIIKDRIPGYYDYLFNNVVEFESHDTVQGGRCKYQWYLNAYNPENDFKGLDPSIT